MAAKVAMKMNIAINALREMNPMQTTSNALNATAHHTAQMVQNAYKSVIVWMESKDSQHQHALNANEDMKFKMEAVRYAIKQHTVQMA